LYRVNGV